MTFYGYSINLGLVEKKIATRTFGLSDMHTTRTLRAHFWRAGILTVDERSAPPAAETSQHQTRKKVKHRNYRTHITNPNR